MTWRNVVYSSIFGDSVAGFSVSSVTLWFNSRPHHRVTEDTEVYIRERNRYAEYENALSAGLCIVRRSDAFPLRMEFKDNADLDLDADASQKGRRFGRE